MDFGGDWHKLVEYIKALEARVAALEDQVGILLLHRDLTPGGDGAAPAPKPRAKR